MTTYDCADPVQRRAGLQAATAAARRGALVVMPTDTMYGIGADAFTPHAVRALLAAKGRQPDTPVPVMVGSWSTIDGLALDVTPTMRTLVEAFWPGGLSLVVRQAPSLAWDLGDTGGTIMVRMPLHPVALDVLREVGPMAVSSANVVGRQPPATAAEAKEQLGMDVAVYLDGGSTPAGVASTIVDLTDETPRVLREGAVTVAELQRIVPAVERAS